MTDTNTISKSNYIFIHIAGSVVLSIMIPYVMGDNISVWTFSFFGGIVMYECCLTIDRRRNRFSILINFLLPVELLVLINYRKRNILLTVILFILWGLLSVVYTALVMRSGRRRKPFHISYNKIRWSLHGSRTLFSIIMIAAILFLGVFYRQPPIPTQVSSDSLNCSVDDCKQSLSQLSFEEFEMLSRNGKLDILRNVCRVEFTELGIEHGFSIKCDALYDEILAKYSESNYTITINEKYIDNPTSFTLLHAMCHECYHAYQHDLLKNNNSHGLLTDEQLSQKQKIYREEFSHYYSAHDDSERNRAQSVEIDADDYANTACIKYLCFYGITYEQASMLVN